MSNIIVFLVMCLVCASSAPRKFDDDLATCAYDEKPYVAHEESICDAPGQIFTANVAVFPHYETLHCLCDRTRGYVRHSHGNCVRAESCIAKNKGKLVCANDERLTLGRCERTCDGGKKICGPITGPLRLKCHCDRERGLVRHSNGNCIDKNLCARMSLAASCGPLETVFSGRSVTPPIYDKLCEPSCDKTDEFCTSKIMPDGEIMKCICDAKRGYNRHSNGSCIFWGICHEILLRKVCSDTEYAPSSPECETACDDNSKKWCGTTFALNDLIYGSRTYRCTCDFSRGLTRHSNGSCVSASACNPEISCSELEIPSSEPVCEKVCNTHSGSWCGEQFIVDDIGGGNRTHRCVCDIFQNLARHSNGSCIDSRACRLAYPEAACNEIEMINLSPDCEETCDMEDGDWCGPRFDTLTEKSVKCACNEGDGFARHSNGSCVNASACNVAYAEDECDVNEITLITSHPPCQSICDRPPDVQCNYTFVNNAMHSCMCKNGFVRHSNGSCVRWHECVGHLTIRDDFPRYPLKECAAEERYSSNECEPACDNYLQLMCSTQVRTASNTSHFCECDASRGFARHSRGNCVDAIECAKKTFTDRCGYGAYLALTDRLKCEKYCDVEFKSSCVFSTLPNGVTHKCLCNEMDGFRRHSNGSCVNGIECATATFAAGCAADEIVQYSMRDDLPCETYCDMNFKPACISSRWSNGFSMKCMCDKEGGLARHSNGSCVNIMACEKEKFETDCRRVDHEHFSSEFKCEEHFDEIGVMHCNKRYFMTNGEVMYCFCDDGYRRHFNGSCIQESS